MHELGIMWANIFSFLYYDLYLTFIFILVVDTPTLSMIEYDNATLKGLQRMLAKPVVKKEPMTVEMLEAIVRDT